MMMMMINDLLQCAVLSQSVLKQKRFVELDPVFEKIDQVTEQFSQMYLKGE